MNEDKPVSKLHDELRKHSDARKKAEREILDIRKELKDLLLVHHATIKDLQKQVAQMHRKIASIDSSKKSAKVKTTARKTSTGKKTPSNRKSKKKSSQRKRGNVSCSLNELVSVIQKKQNGKCRHCTRIITLSDTVVSNGNGRGYYHKTCAEKLHIL